MIDTECYIKSVTSDLKELGVVAACIVGTIIVGYCVVVLLTTLYGIGYLTRYNFYVGLSALFVAAVLVMVANQKQESAKKDSVFEVIFGGSIGPFFLWLSYHMAQWDYQYPSIEFATLVVFLVLVVLSPFALAYARCKKDDVPEQVTPEPVVET